MSKGSSHIDRSLEALISEQGWAEDAPPHACLQGSLGAHSLVTWRHGDSKERVTETGYSESSLIRSDNQHTVTVSSSF